MTNASLIKNRISWIDLAKFFGIFAIVIGHTIQGGWLKHYVYSFHVPLFFFVMGVTSALTNIDSKPFHKYIKKQSYSLLLPYYTFAIISTVVIFVASRFIQFKEVVIFNEPLKLIAKVIIGYCDANKPLWFLPCAFVMCIIAYFIIKYTNKIKSHKARLIVYFSISTILCVLMHINVNHLEINNIIFKTDSAIELLPFFLMGYCFLNYGISEKIKKLNIFVRIIIGIVLISTGAVSGLFNPEAGYLGNYYGNIAIFYLSAFSTILGIIMLCTVVPPIKILTWCGARTLTILLLHKFPILAFQKVIPFTKSYLAEFSIPVGIAVTLITIALCCIADIVITKLVPFLIGKSRSK